jgi:hypothetical protein
MRLLETGQSGRAFAAHLEHNPGRHVMQPRLLSKRSASFGTCALACAVVGAAPATATVNVDGANIFATGSTLQARAQDGSFGSPFPGLNSLWHGNPATDQQWTNGSTTYALDNDPSATYTPTSSANGLAEFGNASSPTCRPGSPALTNTCDTSSPNELDAWIGTDDPPTAANLANAFAASGGATRGSEEVTVPIAQAPVALLVSLPAGVTVGPRGRLNLSNAFVQHIYDNSVPARSQAQSGVDVAASYPANSWGALLLAAGLRVIAATGTPTAAQFTDTGLPCPASGFGSGGCSQIIREVRDGGSGTTYALQGFLSLSGDTRYTTFSDNEALWPGVSVSQGGDGSTTDGCPVGGRNTPKCPTSPTTDPYENGHNKDTATGNWTVYYLVRNTIADPGTIGYAGIADAVISGFGRPFVTTGVQSTRLDNSALHQVVLAEVQSNYAGGTANRPAFAAPGNVLPRGGNVSVTANAYDGSSLLVNGTYKLANNPAQGVGDWFDQPTTDGNSFGGTLADDPNVADHGGTTADYPIVAATFDVAWAHYGAAGLAGTPGYNSSAGAAAAGWSAISYLAFETGATGQNTISTAGLGYQQLPAPIDADAQLAWEGITS